MLVMTVSLAHWLETLHIATNADKKQGPDQGPCLV